MRVTQGSRQLRVLFVIGTAQPGGAERQLVRLATELQRQEHRVRVLFLAAGGPLTGELDLAGVEWSVLRPTGLPLTAPGRNGAAIVRLAWSLATWRPDVVSAWLAGVIWVTLPLAALLTRAKRVAAFRGRVLEKEVGAKRPFFMWAVRHAHAVTVNAPHLEDVAVHWGARVERLAFIPNGVDLPAVPATVTHDPPTAVVVAHYQVYKGHDVLLESLQLVNAPLRVRLVGNGAGRSFIETLSVSLGVTEKVSFVDPPVVVADELQRAQFAIHPSRTEGLSNAILEELAHGLPVVATDVGGTCLLVDDGVTGRLVPAGDAVALAAAIEQLAGSAQLRESLSPMARARATEFGWQQCTARYMALFAELVSTRRPN